MSSTIQFPTKSDPRWTLLVTNGTNRPIKVLAVKLMLMRMSQDVKRDPSLTTISKNIDELFGFFSKNAKMVEADTATLFS